MDVKRIDPFTVELTGTRDEFGFVADAADELAAVDKQGEILGHTQTYVSDDQIGTIRESLNGLPNGKGEITATLTNGISETVLRGAQLTVAKCDEDLARFGNNIRIVTDPLHVRKLGFASIVAQLSPVVEEIKNEQ